MKISVYFDGLTEPKNPGGYGTYGFVVKVDGEVVKRGKGFIGKGAGITNNVCEYIALLRALEYREGAFSQYRRSEVLRRFTACNKSDARRVASEERKSARASQACL
ncbi:MAG: Ribonuclease HI [Methanophagales archaeon]|nr:hypothetical protein [Methanophagales archaeon]MCU4139579.1 Ribonuclease HI [Methanophagales archaeon]